MRTNALHRIAKSQSVFRNELQMNSLRRLVLLSYLDRYNTMLRHYGFLFAALHFHDALVYGVRHFMKNRDLRASIFVASSLELFASTYNLPVSFRIICRKKTSMQIE